MKPVKNLFLLLVLVFATTSSFAQEVKPEKYKSAAYKHSNKRIEGIQARKKQNNVKSELHKDKIKPSAAGSKN